MNNSLVNLLVRWLVLALGVVLSTKLVPGIRYDDGMALGAVVVLLSLCNTVLKPILVLFTLPFIFLSLGIGIWVINALLFYFVGRLVEGFHVDTFWAAMWGALIMSITNLVLSRVLTRAATPPPPPPPPSAPGSGTGRSDDVIDI